MIHITFKIRTVPMRFIVDFGVIFSTEFVAMFTIYIQTKLHMPALTVHILTAIKPKAKHGFNSVAILLSYNLQKEKTLTNIYVSQRSVTIYNSRTLAPLSVLP
jgi:hypothetical protein